MEIGIPEGCTIRSVHLETESQEVYDRLRGQHADSDPTFYETSTSPMRKSGTDTHVISQSFMWRDEDGLVHWVDGPKREVKVTVTDV